MAKPFVPVQRIDVDLWGEHIGSVSMDDATGFYAFAYTPAFCQSDVQPSPLVMPT